MARSLPPGGRHSGMESIMNEPENGRGDEKVGNIA